MDAAAKCAAPSTQRYQRRRPEKTLWYQIVQANLETWLELAAGEFGEAPPAHVERTFRRYLECGIFAHGFARAYCDECRHDFLVAYSCKSRGVCPSCNTRRMVETAAHLVDHVFPRLPVRQWVLAVPKRLRYFLQTDAALQGAVLQILLRVVERCLRELSPGCSTSARIGAVAFIHRFGSSLNEHVHFHCCIIDGVFDPTADTDEAESVAFHAACGLDALTIADVQALVRKRVLRAFVRRDLIDQSDADEMGGWEHDGGFSVNASVCIEGTDRPGLERLLRYCARPPFALEHLQQRDAEHVVYRSPKPIPGKPSNLILTPLELITKIAALVPPPRTHRHRYYGVLAPNAPLRAAVTALAPMAVVAPPPAPATDAAEPAKTKPHIDASRYLWAILLARIYEAFPLICPNCHSQMRIISFINDAGTVGKILDHIGESTQPPRIAPARGPPLWEAAAEQAGNHPQWDLSAQPGPEVEFDQSVAW